MTHTSKELADAFDGKFERAVSIDFWQSVAAGQIDEETRDWLQLVAQRIVAADKVDAGQRAGAVLEAAGLAKSGDKNRRLREALHALRDHGATREEMIKYIEGEFGEELKGIDDVRSLIDRELRKR